MTMTCPYCGSTFQGRRNQRYCSRRCRINAAGKRYRELHPKEYEKKEPKKPKKPSRASTLDAVNEAARSEGLTYGQYRARQYINTVPRINLEDIKK